MEKGLSQKPVNSSLLDKKNTKTQPKGRAITMVVVDKETGKIINRYEYKQVTLTKSDYEKTGTLNSN